MCNKIVIDKKPLFFKNRYSADKKDFNKYKDGRNRYCLVMFGCTIDELYNLDVRTEEENEFIKMYEKYMPLLDTNCVMNILSSKIESFLKSNKLYFKETYSDNIHRKYLSGFEIEQPKYHKVKTRILSYLKEVEELMSTRYMYDKENKTDFTAFKDIMYDDLMKDLMDIVPNQSALSDYVVTLFYTDIKSRSKTLLWDMFGKQIFQNVKKNVSSFTIPVLDELGEIEYLGYRFRLEEVVIGK